MSSKISILIATRDRFDALEQTLHSLAGIEAPEGTEVEILVIDNGSSDATPTLSARSFAGPHPMRYLHVAEQGKSAALNAGLAAAGGDIIALTDDDVRPTPQWLEELCRPIIDDVCDVVAGSVVLAPHLRRDWMTPTHAAWLASTETLDPVAPTTAIGANMAFRKSVLEVVPGYDPELGPGRLGLWEDTLFSMQLLEAGFRLIMAPGAIVEHHFDPDRLSREAFLAYARREAHSAAYVAWHWEHEVRKGFFRRALEYRLRLAIKKLQHPSAAKMEGIPLWELNLISGLEFDRHYLLERKREPLYRLKGLKKNSPANN